MISQKCQNRQIIRKIGKKNCKKVILKKKMLINYQNYIAKCTVQCKKNPKVVIT